MAESKPTTTDDSIENITFTTLELMDSCNQHCLSTFEVNFNNEGNQEVGTLQNTDNAPSLVKIPSCSIQSNVKDWLVNNPVSTARGRKWT